MNLRMVIFSLATLGLLTTQAAAETKVKLSEMHLCCGACVKAVAKAVDGVEGAEVEVDRQGGSATLTAASDEVAQKAVDAIAKAGFHVKSDNERIAVKDDSGAKPGKVKRIELTGIHNCCGGCNKALQKALDEVTGVVGNTAEPKKTTLVVEGEFDAVELIEALYAAGFHAKVKK